MATFDSVWRSIEACAEQVFHTKTGVPFSYAVQRGQVQLNNTNRVIPRNDFAKAHALMPLSGPGQIRDLVQGSAYVFGILTDQRIGA